MLFHKPPPEGSSSGSGLEIESEEARLRAQLDEQGKAHDELVKEHGELNSRYRYLQKELERAGRLQQSLLPQCFRPFDGYRLAALYRPCEAVGGDFYDVIERDDGAVILVCDVVGHGLEAALATMLLKSVFRESAHCQARPDALLREMNDRLQRVIPPDLFAVAAAVRIAAHVSGVEIANAGLPYPFILRCSRNRIEELSLPGFPLGLLTGARYESQTVALEPGDVLLLGTDGIRSIANENGEHFEASNMSRVLDELVGQDGKTVIETLMATALKFGNDNPLPDDVNLVAVTRSHSSSAE